MAMVPVHNPPEGPVMAPLNGMFVGKSVYIFGKIDADASKFEVDLMCGDDTKSSDIALRLNSSFVDNQIIRSTIINNVSGEEEKGGDFPFTKGDYFSFKITCRTSHFEIEVNDESFTTYEHRVPYVLITHVNVTQQCHAILITSEINGAEIPAAALNKPIPGVYLLPFYNVDGRKIQIAATPIDQGLLGTLSSLGSFVFSDVEVGFSINLLTDDGDEIFHYNPRDETSLVVRNTRTGGSWGSEETSLDMVYPFTASGPFKTTISITDNNFVVTINDVPAFTYANRVDGGIKRIRSLEIKNVEVEYIKYF